MDKGFMITKSLPIRSAVNKFNVSVPNEPSVSLLQTPDLTPRRVIQPRSLTSEEDEALVAFAMWLQRGGLLIEESHLVGV